MRFVFLIFVAAGCNSLGDMPPGTQYQSSTFGLRIAPQAVDSAPVVFGSHTTIITTPQPPDAGPNLNRFQGQAPFVDVKSTVASGPVGDELQKAGGPEALDRLLPSRTVPNPISPLVPQ